MKLTLKIELEFHCIAEEKSYSIPFYFDESYYDFKDVKKLASELAKLLIGEFGVDPTYYSIVVTNEAMVTLEEYAFNGIPGLTEDDY